MSVRTATLLFAVTLTCFAGGAGMQARGARQEQSDPPLSTAERVRLLAKGKELFLARCARCHGENGDKPLRTGVPLSERGLSSDVIARAVKGRLADGTDEERRSVTLWFAKTLADCEINDLAAPPATVLL